MKILKYLSLGALAISLAACGGGGGSAASTGGTGGSNGTGGGSVTVPRPVPASVEVLTSANTLSSAGAEAVITAFIKNSANVGLADQPVVFSASSGTLLNPSAITDATGAASVKLIAGSDKSLRNITVTVTAGSALGNVVVPIVGTRISVAGSGTLQAGSAAVAYVVSALDSSSNPVAQAKITVSSSLGNAISSPSLTTDATGVASFFYTPNKAGTDALTVSGLGGSSSATVEVNAIDFVALSPANNALIAIGVDQTIRVQYKNSGLGVAGRTVSFSTTRGSFTTQNSITDVDGQASAILSSTTAGPAVINAQIGGIGSVSLPVQFVAVTPSSIIVQANPGSILPNTSGTTNQSVIEAVVRDVNGNVVANRQVNFTTVQDLSNGTLSPGNSTTDANGRAQVQFISGANSTPANGVLIRAEVASTGIQGETSLTVNGKALFITIGFGNEISNLDETTYSKKFSVYVTDANGVAVGNQLVSLSVIPTDYFKGVLRQDPAASSASYVRPAVETRCRNEDVNLNGILDPNEDTSTDGQLTPGNIVVAAPGNITTDAFGRATFALQYGEQFAPWATVRLTARASVSGTESRQSILFDLRGSVEDFKGDAPPAGLVSPFGSSTSCTNPT